MPLRTISGSAEVVLREEFVGSAGSRICYPGVSSCITITGVLPTGLVGAHITIASEESLIDGALLALKAGGGSNCGNFYVVGAISLFKDNADASFDKRKKIRDKIRSLVNKHAQVWFFETPRNSDVHIFAELNQFVPEFSYIQTDGNTVMGSNYPNFGGRTAIAANQFIHR